MKKEHMDLIDAALEGNISKEKFATLQTLLREDPVAMRHYCEQAEIDGYLEWELKEKSSVPDDGMRQKKKAKTILIAGMAAVAGILLTLFLLRSVDAQQQGSGTEDLASETETSASSDTASRKADLYKSDPHASLARITKTQKAYWKNDQLKMGAWLKAGTYELKKGDAEITFSSGARVLLHAPATIVAISPHYARLSAGQGVVHIPRQAQGFRLETPSNHFSDDDCSFALRVEGNSTEVHVIKGTVVTDKDQRLAANQSARLHKGESGNETAQLELKSLSRELPMSEGYRETEYLRWSFDSCNLGVFSEDGNHTEADYSAVVAKAPQAIQEAEATTVSGKFKRAIRLNGKGTMLKTTFPGIAGTKERTICAWVRIPRDMDKDAHGYSIIGWGDPFSKRGHKWQVGWNSFHPEKGARGALRTEFGGGYVIGTTDLRDGQWHHITSVYMGGEGEVVDKVLHYVDGKLEAVTDSKHIKINTQTKRSEKGYARIGQRLENDLLPRTFTGDIDELYVFLSALTPAQIEELRLYNRPPRQVIQSLVSTE